MNRAPGLGRAGIHEHVDPSRVTGGEPERLDGLYNGLELRSTHGDIDVACRAGRAAIAVMHVEKDGHAADDAVVDAGLSERPPQATDRIEELVPRDDPRRRRSARYRA
jgi:hypothetical protein